MWITPAYAQTGTQPAGGALGLFVPLILVFVIFYFLIIRPQNKRMREHREMVNAVQRGDTVVTSGGIIGKVTRVSDDEVEIEIADKVRVRVVKATLAEVRSKNEPRTPAASDDKRKRS
ncbi:MAG: preprotein translocase subunit YajC [Alphaproteobacteria bacterium]|nr:MAG: preprotein translocase subunit YajC [Alphaproteobacteria bacterium]